MVVNSMINSVVVCIPTCDRPELLARALDSVLAQDTPGIRVVVADNSPSRSAEELCQQHPMAPVYVCEPRPGVVHVRNLLLSTAEKLGADAVLFLDDDMTLREDAVSSFLSAAQRYPGAVLTGPVAYELEGVAPDGWQPIVRRAHEDGALLRVTGTGNSWLPLDVWKERGRPLFDDQFGLTGGEDTDFFHRLTSQGVELRWCSGGLAMEAVPAERATPNALAKRYERAGYVNGRLALRSRPKPVVLLLGVIRLVAGFLLRPVPLALRPWMPHPRATFYAGVGHLRAVLGRPLGHYGRGQQQ